MKNDYRHVETAGDRDLQDKSLEFDMTDAEKTRAFAKLIDELQSSGARWRLQQDGTKVWVVMA